jgi:RNA polymerase sigma-70 factor (ECF subfamily)
MPAPSHLAYDLGRLFGRLKPQQRALLWLAYVEGFDHGEIAAMLDLREGSVRVLLHRTRRKMAGILTSHGFGPPARADVRKAGNDA